MNILLDLDGTLTDPRIALWGYGSRQELAAGAAALCEQPKQLCEILSTRA